MASERFQRRIDRILDQLEDAADRRDWPAVRQGALILDEAYLEIFPTVREGDTEREVHSRIVASCVQRGAQWAQGGKGGPRGPRERGMRAAQGPGSGGYGPGPRECGTWKFLEEVSCYPN